MAFEYDEDEDDMILVGGGTEELKETAASSTNKLASRSEGVPLRLSRGSGKRSPEWFALPQAE
jgi:hypothetical protein